MRVVQIQTRERVINVEIDFQRVKQVGYGQWNYYFTATEETNEDEDFEKQEFEDFYFHDTDSQFYEDSRNQMDDEMIYDRFEQLFTDKINEKD